MGRTRILGRDSRVTLTVAGLVLAAGAATVTPADSTGADWARDLPTAPSVLSESITATTPAALTSPVTPGNAVRALVPAMLAGTAAAHTATSPGPAGNGKAYAFLATNPVGRWNPCATIGYRVNAAGGGAGALSDAQGAVRRVASATGLTLVYRGPTAVIPGARTGSYPADTQLVIAWARPGQSRFLPQAPKGYVGAAGVGGGAWRNGYDSRGKVWSQIVQGYVVLDASIRLTAGFGAGPSTGWQGTRGQLLMHEVGHAVGLDHPRINDRAQIMYPTMSRKPAVWGAGDLNGLKIVGKASGCLYATVRASYPVNTSN